MESEKLKKKIKKSYNLFMKFKFRMLGKEIGEYRNLLKEIEKLLEVKERANKEIWKTQQEFLDNYQEKMARLSIAFDDKKFNEENKAQKKWVNNHLIERGLAQKRWIEASERLDKLNPILKHYGLEIL